MWAKVLIHLRRWLHLDISGRLSSSKFNQLLNSVTLAPCFQRLALVLLAFISVGNQEQTLHAFKGLLSLILRAHLAISCYQIIQFRIKLPDVQLRRYRGMVLTAWQFLDASPVLGVYVDVLEFPKTLDRSDLEPQLE